MKIAIAFWVLWVIPAFGQEFQWNKIEVEGVEYVPVARLSEFYGFKGPKSDGEEVTLEGQDVTMVFESGSKKAAFNGVRFLLEQKLIKKDDGFLVSAADLKQIIDPVLRPAKVKGLGGMNLVLVDLEIPDGYPDREQFGKELESALTRIGFQAKIFGAGKEPFPEGAELGELSEDEKPVYLKITLRDGEVESLTSKTHGPMIKPSLALSTGIHWFVLKGMEREKLAGFEDGRISVDREANVPAINFPGCQMEFTLGFSDEAMSLEKRREFHQKVASKVSTSLNFVRKAAGRVGEEEEK